MDNTGLYVSKDNGLTWTKRVGNRLTRSVYGGKFVDVGTSLSLITKRNQRTDGSSISPDVITIGREGTNATIASDSLTLSSNVLAVTGKVGITGGLNVTGNVEINGSIGNTKVTGALEAGGPNPGYAGVFIRRQNNAPNRYDVNVLGFGNGGKSITDEPSDLGDYTGLTGTSCCARIKCVSNTDFNGGTFDYGSIGSLYFQFKNNNLWANSTSDGVYNTAMYINGQTRRVGIGTVTPEYLLDVSGSARVKGNFSSASLTSGATTLSGGLSLGAGDTANHLTFTRNGPFTMGIDAGNPSKLILGAATNGVSIPGSLSAGYVGIGLNTSPSFPLIIGTWLRLENNALVGYVNGASASIIGGTTVRAFFYGNSGPYVTTTVSSVSGLGGSDWPAIQTVSAFAVGSYITLAGFISVSDRRIKTNIVDIDDDRALRDLRLLKPKTYTYKDVFQKGSTPVYGFIAQEVKEVLNYASSYITETVPNVYELATFSGDILTLTFNTSELSRDPSGVLFPRLKLKTREEKDEFVNILEIIDAHTLRVDKDLTDWGGELVGDQIVPGNRIFVYGQEVNDFHTLNKDAIWTVATAALQEVDRQLQAEKQKTALMQTALDALLERVIALEQKTSV